MHRPFTAVLVLLAGSAHAADGGPSPSSMTLSLKDALSLARERAPAVVLARQRVEIARGRLLGVEPWLADNPSLNAGAAARMNPSQTSADLDLSISQAFELGGQQGARRSSADASIAEALAVSDDVARLALSSVGDAFVEALAAESSAKLATQTLLRAEGLFTIAGRRHTAGEASGVDVQLATAQLARATARVASARAEQLKAFGALRVALGLPAQVELVLDGTALSLELQQPVGERADLRALGAQREGAVAEGRAAEGAAWPTVQATAGYSLDDGDHLVGGSIGIPIPVFARGQGDAAAARAQVAALDVEIAALTQSAQTEIVTASAALLERRAASKAMADGVAAARESARLARRGYEAGDSSLADLLVIEREALIFQEEQITLQSDEAHAALAVFIAAGATP
jgi:outer membrane protein, heavy metal efflux system